MGLLGKLKEKAEEHIVSVLLGLIVLLFLIIWRAVPSELWDRLLQIVPKQVLWAVLGLLFIASILEFAYIRVLRKEAAGKMKARFGVLWSKDLVPHCPSCLSTLTSYGQYSTSHGFSSVWGFRCVKCDALIVMADDEGNALELKNAKQLLATNPSKSQQADKNGEITEIEEKILVRLTRKKDGLTAEDLTRFLTLHPDRVTFILGQMDKKGYIYSINTMLGYGDPTTYHLADKGRSFLMNKNVI
jgi:hypothetical protein